MLSSSHANLLSGIEQTFFSSRISPHAAPPIPGVLIPCLAALSSFSSGLSLDITFVCVAECKHKLILFATQQARQELS